MDVMSTDRRRAHDRVDLDLDVTIVVDGQAIEGRCRNISQGGMFVETTATLPMDGLVRVRFTLPDLRGDAIDAECRVRWVERDATGQRGVGLQFTGLRAIEVWAINQLFRRRSKP